MVWRRVLWAIQLVVFVTAGLFVAPFARSSENVTVTAAQSGERVVASRERSGERALRIRTDHTGDAIAFTPPALPNISRARFVVEAARARVVSAPRVARRSPHAPRGPPQLG